MTSTPPADAANGTPPQAPALPPPPVAPGEPSSFAPPPQAYPPSSPAQQQWLAAPRRTGIIAWGLGLLILVPLVYVNVLAMAITVVAVGLAQRKHGGIAADNGCNAANWALSLFVVSIVVLGLGVILGLPGMTNGDPWQISAYPLSFLLFIGLGMAHLVIPIVGMVKAGQGTVFRPPSIRFFRP